MGAARATERRISMSARLFFSLCVLTTLRTGVTLAQDAKKELDKLQGTWQVVEDAQGGRSVPPAKLKGLKFVFAGDKMRMVGPGWTTEYMVKLDPATDPKSIDAQLGDARAGGILLLGIFKLDKDRLTLALDMNAKKSARPAAFDAKRGSPVRKWVLEAEKR